MKHLLPEWPPLSSRGLCGIAGAAALAPIAVAQRQSLRVPVVGVLAAGAMLHERTARCECAVLRAGQMIGYGYGQGCR
jgi:hypothetical protein